MSSSDTLAANASAVAGNLPASRDGINPTAGKDGRANSNPLDAFDRICGNCGYRLIGLPRSGICPECGQQYEADELVIPGWAAGPHVRLTTAPPRRVWRIALCSTGCFWMWAVNELLAHHAGLALGFVAVGAVTLGWGLYRRRKLINDFGCTSHLRISPRGLAQREGFGPAKLVPWLRGLQITLAPEGKGMYMLAVSRSGPGSVYRKAKTQWPIAFQFECTREKAVALSQILQRYEK